jgi:DNA-binding transcriptional ArsR family regulator
MMPISKTEAKIINYLYKHNDEGLYAAEIARQVKVARRTTYESLDSLEKKGILKKRLVGKMKLYSLDEKWKGVAEAAKTTLAETDEALPPKVAKREEKTKELQEIKERGKILSEEIESFISTSLRLNLLDKGEIRKLKEAREVISKETERQ